MDYTMQGSNKSPLSKEAWLGKMIFLQCKEVSQRQCRSHWKKKQLPQKTKHQRKHHSLPSCRVEEVPLRTPVVKGCYTPVDQHGAMENPAFWWYWPYLPGKHGDFPWHHGTGWTGPPHHPLFGSAWIDPNCWCQGHETRWELQGMPVMPGGKGV